MGSILKEVNNAENHLVVGSLEVLGEVKNQGVQTLKDTVDNLTLGIATISDNLTRYWEGISNDLIIDVTEKVVLKSKFETITQTYTALYEMAKSKGISLAGEVVSLTAAYDDLKKYLYNELKVFDIMSKSTSIPNLTTFNENFQTYYGSEALCQLILSTTSSRIRVLGTLTTKGAYDGEIASYINRIYKWNESSQKWETFTVPNYIGVIKNSTEFNKITPLADYYFVAAATFTVSSKTYEKGYIYYYNTSSQWEKVSDKDNWRYSVALVDMLKNNLPTSSTFEDYVKTKAKESADALKDELMPIIEKREPEYLGVKTKFPPSDEIINGDRFLWGELQTTVTYYVINGVAVYTEPTSGTYSPKSLTLKKAYLYYYDEPEWKELDPKVRVNSKNFMESLDDILDLTVNDDDNGYFSTIFARALYSNLACIKELMTKQLTLQEGGSIQSEDWKDTGDTGFKIGADGNVTFNNGTFRGAIYSTGASVIGGKCNVDMLHFTIHSGEPDNLQNGDMWLQKI